MKKRLVALFIGRFQPLHNGHLTVIKRLAKRSKLLKIGIGSSQYSDTKDNPLSGKERKAMLQSVLKSEHITNAKIFYLPDIHDDENWTAHVQKTVGKFDVVYSGNTWVIRLFKKAKVPIKIIKEIDPYEATKIREAIRKGKRIDYLVPKQVLLFLKKNNLFDRIKTTREL